MGNGNLVYAFGNVTSVFNAQESKKIHRKRRNAFSDEEYKLIMRNDFEKLLDEKTGLYKPIVVEYFWNKYLEHKEAGRIRDNRKVGLIYVDIDNSKHINDTHGHDAGDLVIKETAEVIKKCIRGRDLAARVGGDEFIILLVGSSTYDSANVARRIGDSIQNHRILNTYKVTASIGVVKSNNGYKLSTVIKNADLAMYKAKNLGRNTCVVMDYNGVLGVI